MKQTTTTSAYVLRLEYLLSDDISHPAFKMANMISEAEYANLTAVQKTYYVFVK